MKKKIKTLFFLLLSLILILPIIFYSFFGLRIILTLHSPLRQSEEQIQTWLLEEVPIGSSRNEVRMFLNGIRNEWWRGSDRYARNQGIHEFENLMRVALGNHITFLLIPFPIPFEEWVSVNWQFDRSGILIAIEVEKGVK